MSHLTNVISATLGNLAPPIAAIVTAPLLAQALGVEGRGEVAAATAPLLLATAAFGLGLPEAVTFYVARGVARQRRLIYVALSILAFAGVVANVLIVALGPVLTGGDRAVLGLMLIASAATIPSLLTYGLRGLAAGVGAWRLILFERVISSFLRVAAIVALFATGGLTVLTGTIAIAATSFAGGLVYLFLLGRRQHSDAPLDIRAPTLIGYSSRIWIGTLTGILLSRVDQTLMLPLSSAYELGLYAVAVNVAEVSLVVNNAIRDTTFSRASAGNMPHSELGFASRLSTTVTFVIAGTLALGSVWFVPLLFGSGFFGAVPVIWWLLFGVIAGNPGSVAGAGLSGAGRPELRSVALTAGLVVNLACLFIFVPRFGAVGAAVATLAGNAAAGYGNIFFLKFFFGAPVSSFFGLRRSDVRDVRALLRGLNGRSA